MAGMSAPTGPERMKVARLLGYALLAVSLVYFLRALWQHAGALPVIRWNAATLSGAVLSLILYMGQFAVTGVAWHLWLRSLGERSRAADAVALVALSQFVKYVPGSIAQHIARVGLGRRHGLSTSGILLSIALEIAWSLAAGAVIAVLGLAFLGLPLVQAAALPSPAVMVPALAVMILVPCGGIWLLGPRRPAFVARWLRAGDAAYPRPGTMLACFLLYALNQTVCGIILSVLAVFVFDASAAHLLHAIGVVALAWVAGMLVLVAPAGIGVRESILLVALAPAFGSGAALGIAIAYRVVSSLGDGLGFLAGLIAERRLRSRTINGTAGPGGD